MNKKITLFIDSKTSKSNALIKKNEGKRIFINSFSKPREKQTLFLSKSRNTYHMKMTELLSIQGYILLHEISPLVVTQVKSGFHLKAAHVKSPIPLALTTRRPLGSAPSLLAFASYLKYGFLPFSH